MDCPQSGGGLDKVRALTALEVSWAFLNFIAGDCKKHRQGSGSLSVFCASVAFSMASLAGRWACIAPPCGNQCFPTGQKQQIIRTRLFRNEFGLYWFGAGMGTRTPTPEAREPKSRMSTNSIMPAEERNPLFLHGEGARGGANRCIRSGKHGSSLGLPVGLYPWILHNSTIPGPMGQ